MKTLEQLKRDRGYREALIREEADQARPIIEAAELAEAIKAHCKRKRISAHRFQRGLGAGTGAKLIINHGFSRPQMIVLLILKGLGYKLVKDEDGGGN